MGFGSPSALASATGTRTRTQKRHPKKRMTCNLFFCSVIKSETRTSQCKSEKLPTTPLNPSPPPTAARGRHPLFTEMQRSSYVMERVTLLFSGLLSPSSQPLQYLYEFGHEAHRGRQAHQEEQICRQTKGSNTSPSVSWDFEGNEFSCFKEKPS